LTIKVNLIFELNTAFVEVIRENSKNKHDNRFKRDVVFERMPHSFPTIDEAAKNFRRELIRKEADIGGIIDATTVVCRYFKLR